MGTTQVDVHLPEELLAQADITAAVTEQTRTELVTAAVRQYLSEKVSDEQFRDAVVDLFLAGEIEYETVVDVIGKEGAEAITVSEA